MASKSFGNKGPQKPHLVQGTGGISGEVTDLRSDIEEAFVSMEDLGVTGTGPLCIQEFTNPVAAAAAGLEAATAVTVAPRTVTVFVAGGVAALLAFPRNLTFSTAGSTPADAPATATITGTDINGAALTEIVNVSQTVAKVEGVKCFRTVISVAYSAGQGTDATVSIGFGAVFGLAKKAKTRAGAVNVLAEFAIGAKVTTGTFVGPATSAPNGSYAPAAAPEGTNDYVVMFEKDMA
jgi:hypothetical protein